MRSLYDMICTIVESCITAILSVSYSFPKGVSKPFQCLRYLEINRTMGIYSYFVHFIELAGIKNSLP